MCSLNTDICRLYNSKSFEIQDIFWIYCEFWSEYQAQLSLKFPPFSLFPAQNQSQNQIEIKSGQTQFERVKIRLKSFPL